MSSPITGEDLEAVTAGATACDHLAELAATRTKLKTLVEYIFDEDGNFTEDFLTLLLEQVLADDGEDDPDTNGYYLRTNPTTGKLELIEKFPITALEGGAAVDGDTLKWDEDALGSSPDVGAWVPFHEYVSGQSALPSAASGGKIEAAHGLGYRPKHYRVELVCVAADGSYAEDDVVEGVSLIQQGGGGEIRPGCSVGADDTNVWAIFIKDGSTPTRKYFLPDKSTFEADGGTALDSSKWEVRLIAS